MSSTFAIGYLNHVVRSAAIMTASNAQSGWPASNLKTPRLSARWRGAVADLTEWFQADLNATLPVDVVALLGTNVTDAFTVRVRVDSDPIAAPYAYDSTVVPAFDLTIPALVASHHPAGRSVIKVLPQSASGEIVFVDLASDAGNPDNYYAVGHLWAGPLWSPAVSWQSVQIEHEELPFVGALRVVEVELRNLSLTERVQLESIWRSKGTTGRLLVITRSDSNVIHHEAVYGTFASSPSFSSSSPFSSAWNATLKFKEELD